MKCLLLFISNRLTTTAVSRMQSLECSHQAHRQPISPRILPRSPMILRGCLAASFNGEPPSQRPRCTKNNKRVALDQLPRYSRMLGKQYF
ncbi:hypothetical protein B0T17DRAFT_111006 [Bombardia bombarda]|uniref:Uncharacterized protein n=1 Tax=Bombardia bombarda TaxID=252184 RepID=A0AA39W417_9PEZI|nr:hypothetical protein B0T17DRAFT_111006 [Bombardia bombarda]